MTMPYLLTFPVRHRFKSAEIGITIPFSLSVNGLTIISEAKIDTGSEFCFFPREMAEELQLEVEDGYPMKLSTLAGSITAYFHTVEVYTFGIKFESSVLFTSAYGTTRSILGRTGWLDHLHLALTMDDEMVYLNPAYSQDTL